MSKKKPPARPHLAGVSSAVWRRRTLGRRQRAAANESGAGIESTRPEDIRRVVETSRYPVTLGVKL
ncbi:MAG: hypothetical protein M0Z66_17200 [Thermaerobacter sp.]|nr:hypothetical protein [Thermaerobacter sp.]